MSNKILKIVLACILLIVLIAYITYCDTMQRTENDYNEYLNNTKESFETYITNVENISDNNISFEDLTSSFIAFQNTSYEWRRLYCKLEKNDKQPGEVLRYDAIDFVIEVENLYYMVANFYYLKDDIKGEQINEATVMEQLKMVKSMMTELGTLF